MIKAKILMGMPVIVEVAEAGVTNKDFDVVYDYFDYIDQKFSTYKPESEVSQINCGKLKPLKYSNDMRQILDLCNKTKKETAGYFDISRDGKIDPSGIVKGWAVKKAAQILTDRGFRNFYVDAGGDIQVKGLNSKNKAWSVGIRNPFKYEEIIKVLFIKDSGVATSGTYIRGQHVYNPKNRFQELTEIVSLTVIGPDIYEADRFATAAFAMGQKGINFIQKLNGFEGYSINKDGVATYTSGFNRFTIEP